MEWAVQRAGGAVLVEVEVAQARLPQAVEVAVVAVAGKVIEEAAVEASL